MHKEAKIVILLLVIFLNPSCDEKLTTESNTDIKLIATDQETLYYGDTLTIYGNNFYSNSTKLLASQDKDTFDISQGLIFVNKSELKFVNSQLSGNYEIFLKNGSEFSNSISLELFLYPNLQTVEVQAGKFMLGSFIGVSDERPVREIEISRNLEVAVYEISEFLWKTISIDNGYFKSSRRKPAVGIEWLSAIRFCNKLSNLQGLDSVYFISDFDNSVFFDTTRNGWRLPTEAEWEYLAKAGTGDDFYGFDALQIAWYSENSGSNLQPIGRLMPNQFGLYDILGNAEEWCWDLYSENSYSNISSVDPIGVILGFDRVSRGGSFRSGKANIRTSSRNSDQDPATKGFRIVRTKK